MYCLQRFTNIATVLNKDTKPVHKYIPEIVYEWESCVDSNHLQKPLVTFPVQRPGRTKHSIFM